LTGLTGFTGFLLLLYPDHPVYPVKKGNSYILNLTPFRVNFSDRINEIYMICSYILIVLYILSKMKIPIQFN
jgi:hypothetical protein